MTHPTPPTASELQQIRERAEKATPGPWSAESCGEKGDGANMIGVSFDPVADPDCENQLSGWLREWNDDGSEIEYYRDELVAECDHHNHNSGADADFIIHARTDIPALLALVEAKDAEIARLKETEERLATIAQDAIDGSRLIASERDEAKAAIARKDAALNMVRTEAKKLRHASDLVGPAEYHNEPKLMRVWQKACYRAGKDILDKLRVSAAHGGEHG